MSTRSLISIPSFRGNFIIEKAFLHKAHGICLCLVAYGFLLDEPAYNEHLRMNDKETKSRSNSAAQLNLIETKRVKVYLIHVFSNRNNL
ncbi:uncharacterized protein Bfra_001527 [Botrytis fragariae]|uniref:Uncharacterized protein n=1 Tax=Botrytis fragariae TaxID=1964551 RepID=A0A8H6B0J7_9HELO|nr:uncharacterized protein Bfra_001527 [Botrytis fragariae]KAF5877164.1 hypothetical protein Bfra_001527 [Botrytis fragariae]